MFQTTESSYVTVGRQLSRVIKDWTDKLNGKHTAYIIISILYFCSIYVSLKTEPNIENFPAWFSVEKEMKMQKRQYQELEMKSNGVLEDFRRLSVQYTEVVDKNESMEAHLKDLLRVIIFRIRAATYCLILLKLIGWKRC